MEYDAIVIGSGFGGAITACRLQERGYKVLVLERGRRWNKSNFPRAPGDPWLWESERPEHGNGWLELHKFPNMWVASGAAVGGGSQIYANISCEAPPSRFERGWPEEITYRELKPYYDTVKQFMNVREVPDNQWTERMKLMREAADRAGLGNRFRKLELAVTFDDAWTYADFPQGKAASKTIINQQGAQQGTCVHLGNCDVGCDVHAKNTLDLNYLYWAEKKGAEVRPLHLVHNVEPVAAGYRVHYDELRGGQRFPGSERARLVIVAAGSLGSTELLLRCKQEAKTLPNISDFLGKNWSSNGDFLTPAVYLNRNIAPTRGPTIACAIDMYEPNGGPASGGLEGSFWIEDGGFPDLLFDLVDRKAAQPSIGFKAKELLEFIQRALRLGGPVQGVMPWFAQGVDAADGKLQLNHRSWLDTRTQLDLEWDISRSRPTVERIVAMHKRLSEVTGGLPLVPPTWTLFRDLITPHPLGGCNMGQDASRGVVNHKGEVFGHPGLYVADGAIVPEALGVNPSRTIGALAERIASILTTEGK